MTPDLDTLLSDINKAAHAAGTNAWVQDVLQRSHRAIRDMRMLKAFVAQAAEKRKNCKHSNRTGTGMVASDGSSHYDWYCRECGASGHSETPASPTVAPNYL